MTHQLKILVYSFTGTSGSHTSTVILQIPWLMFYVSISWSDYNHSLNNLYIYIWTMYHLINTKHSYDSPHHFSVCGTSQTEVVSD